MKDGPIASMRLAVTITALGLVMFFWGLLWNQTTSFSKSLPSPDAIIQLVMRDLEAEEKISGERDDYVRGQIDKAWVYLGRAPLALDDLRRGTETWNAINFSIAVQTQVRVTGHAPSAEELAKLNLSEEEAWLVPLSIAEGFLESGRTTEARSTLQSVPVNRGTLRAAIRVFYRLGQQLQDNGADDELHEVLQQAATYMEAHLLLPEDELHLALFTRLAAQSNLSDLAERFCRQAISVSDKYQPQDVPNSLPYPAFATLQGALACFEIGDVNESQTRIELAIQQAKQIISGESVSERDIRERSVTLEKLARRLQEFGHPVDALRCLEQSASHTTQLEALFGRDARFRDLTVAAHDLGHHELADQFEARIETPSWKLIAVRDQVDRLRVSGRTAEARVTLLAAEDQLPNILELSSCIGEIAEL